MWRAKRCKQSIDDSILHRIMVDTPAAHYAAALVRFGRETSAISFLLYNHCSAVCLLPVKPAFLEFNQTTLREYHFVCSRCVRKALCFRGNENSWAGCIDSSFELSAAGTFCSLSCFKRVKEYVITSKHEIVNRN